MKLLSVSIPEYTVDTEPNHKAIGKPVDDLLKKHFMGQKVLIRGLGSMEHPGKSVDEVIEIIKTTGTDRYDPKRIGDRYTNTGDKYPVRVDILIIYDPRQLKAVTYSPVGHEGRIMRDGFVFRNTDDKAGAILGIIKIQ